MKQEQERVGNEPRPAIKGAQPSVEELFAGALRHYRNGRLDEAVGCYRRAVDLRPDNPDGYNNLGNVLAQQSRLDEATACYRQALELKPDFPEAHVNLGKVLQQQSRLEEAMTCYRRALDLRLNFPAAYNELGGALVLAGRLDEAVACYRRARDLRPDSPEAHVDVGNALQQQGQLDEAIAYYRRALRLRPGYPDAQVNLGNVLQQQMRLAEAVDCYRQALDLRPDFPEAHNNLAMVLLAMGQLETGWEEFEWRWRVPQKTMSSRHFVQPRWCGEAGEQRTLLIHAEQGFGDTLQFCRYATLASAHGFRVILQVPESLVRLLRSLARVDVVVGIGEDLPSFDLHCPMLSMPRASGTTLANIPSASAYLHADAAQATNWRTRLATVASKEMRVGLAWAGSSRRHLPEAAAVDRRRSIIPDQLAPLFDMTGVQFFSLQKDGPAAPSAFPLIDLMSEMADFADTAALVVNLDLVISVDTAVAHLAAALGKPVWMLDRFDSCWRWLVGRRDSPWYPTLRIYRQPHPGDWDSVVTEVARDLRDLV